MSYNYVGQGLEADRISLVGASTPTIKASSIVEEIYRRSYYGDARELPSNSEIDMREDSICVGREAPFLRITIIQTHILKLYGIFCSIVQ